MSPFSNPFLFLSIVASVIVHLAAIYWAPLASIFSLTPLGLNDWAVIIPVALTVVVAVEGDKLARKVLKRKAQT
jgi:Ca2+-transporting ATPase